jgi:hypothetical protein
LCDIRIFDEKKMATLNFPLKKYSYAIESLMIMCFRKQANKMVENYTREQVLAMIKTKVNRFAFLNGILHIILKFTTGTAPPHVQIHSLIIYSGLYFGRKGYLPHPPHRKIIFPPPKKTV